MYKNVKSLACYNCNMHQLMLIICGRTVAEKVLVSSQVMTYFSYHTSVSSSAMPKRDMKPRNCVLSLCYYYYYYYYNHFTILCPGLPRWVDARRINRSGFCWSRDDGVAVASAEPYASYLHLAPEDNHASTSSVRFLWTWCSSWHPANSAKTLMAHDEVTSPFTLLLCKKPQNIQIITWSHLNQPSLAKQTSVCGCTKQNLGRASITCYYALDVDCAFFLDSTFGLLSYLPSNPAPWGLWVLLK